MIGLRRVLRYALPAAVLIVLLAGGGFAALETHTVGSLGEGVWWALSLVTTVGFIGAAPVTTGGRLLAALLMVLGFVLLSLTTATVASLIVREDEAAAERRDMRFESEVLSALRDIEARLDSVERHEGRPGDAPPDEDPEGDGAGPGRARDVP